MKAITFGLFSLLISLTSHAAKFTEISYHDEWHNLLSTQYIGCSGRVTGTEPASYDHKHTISETCGLGSQDNEKTSSDKAISVNESQFVDEVVEFCETRYATSEEQLACASVVTENRKPIHFVLDESFTKASLSVSLHCSVLYEYTFDRIFRCKATPSGGASPYSYSWSSNSSTSSTANYSVFCDSSKRVTVTVTDSTGSSTSSSGTMYGHSCPY